MTSSYLQPGTALHGKYLVERELAVGGTCRLYTGHPLSGAGLVAIKELRPSADPDERRLEIEQFQREYDLLDSLDHPALPRALDFFEESGRVYLVEEFVPGESLEKRLADRQRMRPEQALRITRDLLAVLGYLHERNVIYRDVKPSNILLTREGGLRLIDLGAARHHKPRATRDTMPLGTPGYAPPEQYGTAQTDERSDVYSVGVLLHQMLTGIDPVAGEPFHFEPPIAVVPTLPRRISECVMRALRLDPAERFQTAREMRQTLLGKGALPKPPDLARPRPPRQLQPLQSSDLTEYVRTIARSGIYLYTALPAPFIGPALALDPGRPVWVSCVLGTIVAVAFVWIVATGLIVAAYSQFLVEVRRDGLEVVGLFTTRRIRWKDIDALEVVTPINRLNGSGYATLHVGPRRVAFSALWPPVEQLVREVVCHARLVDGGSVPGRCWSTRGCYVHFYER